MAIPVKGTYKRNLAIAYRVPPLDQTVPAAKVDVLYQFIMLTPIPEIPVAEVTYSISWVALEIK